MRLFIAIDFNELKDYLIELQGKIDKSLSKLKECSTFHLTLKFLGEVSEHTADLIKDKLKKIEFKPFSLSLDKIGVFPSENYIKVIWVGVIPKKEVIELHKKIEESLKEFKFKNDFEFHPHITLARVKFIKEKDEFIKNLMNIKVDNKRIEVRDFRLVKSTLLQKGAVYEDLDEKTEKPIAL